MGEKRVQRHVLSFSARATSRFPQEWTRLRVELLEKLRAGQAALKLEGEDGKVVKPQELLLELGWGAAGRGRPETGAPEPLAGTPRTWDRRGLGVPGSGKAAWRDPH